MHVLNGCVYLEINCHILPDPYMLTKISRKETLENYPKFPQSNNLTEELIYPKVHSTFILTLQAKSVRGTQKSYQLNWMGKIGYFFLSLYLANKK
jgi:hypothetical protein